MSMTWLIGAVLCALFLLGMIAAKQFAPTPYGRVVVTVVNAVLTVAYKGPVRMYFTVFFYNLCTFLMFSATATLPGGALWLAPVLGVNMGLIGQQIEWREPKKRREVSLGFYIVLAFFTFVLELSILGWSAIMATWQSLDLSWNPYRTIGMLWVMGPSVVFVFALSSAFETLLVYCEPAEPENIASKIQEQ